MEQLSLSGHDCLIRKKGSPAFLIVQCISEMDEPGELPMEEDYLLASLKITDWNNQLSPWDAPAVFGKEDFGHDAAATLESIEKELLPYLIDHYQLDPQIPVILGGYSLAGLFSLWSAYQSDVFSGIAAASPSVWFPDWICYAESHEIKSECVYLSLGDKEEKTKNRTMATVGKCIRRQHELLQPIHCILEWNEGNHFQDPQGRLNKGISWCIRNLKEKY